MTGYLKVFNHPYFAVTDEDGNFKIEKAPAGKYHIVAWQESVGYVNKGLKKGDPIEIKPDDVTEVNFEVKPKCGRSDPTERRGVIPPGPRRASEGF